MCNREDRILSQLVPVRRIATTILALSLWLVALFSMHEGSTADFRIIDLQTTLGIGSQVTVPSQTNSYYLLLRGTNVGDITTPVSVRTGNNGMTILPDFAAPPPDHAFYRVRQVPAEFPLDLDNDGIDDLFELAHPGVLDPLNPADAATDSDGDGRSWLYEYQQLHPPGLRILRTLIGPQGEAVVEIASREDAYYVLLRGESVSAVDVLVGMSLGNGGLLALRDSGPVTARAASFYRVQEVPRDLAFDSDGDGLDDVMELSQPGYLNPLDASDAVTRVISTSPADGETAVATNRSAILVFSAPLAAGTVITTNELFAESDGVRLNAVPSVGPDRQQVMLRFPSGLPDGRPVQVTFQTGGLQDFAGRLVDGDWDGTPGGAVAFTFWTGNGGTPQTSRIFGRVFGGHQLRRPVENAIVTVVGSDLPKQAVTDSLGRFAIDDAPIGQVDLLVDGRTVVDLEEGIQFPGPTYYGLATVRCNVTAFRESASGDITIPLVATNMILRTTNSASSTEVIRPTWAIEVEGVNLSNLSISHTDKYNHPSGVPLFKLPDDLLALGVINYYRYYPYRDAFYFSVHQVDPSIPFRPIVIRVAAFYYNQELNDILWRFNTQNGKYEVYGTVTKPVEEFGYFEFRVCNPGYYAILGCPQVANLSQGNLGGADPFEVCLLCCQLPFRPTPCDTVDSPPVPEGYELVDSKEVNGVRLYSGEKIESDVDLHVKGRGFDFEWRRTYRSCKNSTSAQGNNWDWSYNIRLIEEGRGIRVCNGAAREDLFRPRADGKRVYNGFFRELNENGSSGLSQQHEDGTVWNFLPLDGSPLSGRIYSIVDRNGNTMEFFYDGQGRLGTVIDTLNREFTVEYDGAGFISAVRDPWGRRVEYGYYAGSESGGSSGDLKSARTLAVTGTPQGNDFPMGKKTSYTYSKGYTNELLNHNLLTITDGRGNDPNETNAPPGPYEINTYGTDLDDPATFDKVIMQVWGGPTNQPGLDAEADNQIRIHYRVTLSHVDVNRMTKEADVIDRNGNRRGYSYDEDNRLVARREYLRIPEEYFAHTLWDYHHLTRWDYNLDNQPTRIVRPNGDTSVFTYEEGLNYAAASPQRGNLRQVRRGNLPVTSRSPEVKCCCSLDGADGVVPQGQPIYRINSCVDVSVTEHFEYFGDFGTKFFGLPMRFVTRHTDGRGHTVFSSFSPSGNLLQKQHRSAGIVEDFDYNTHGQMTSHVLPDNGSGHRRRDEFTYTNGYLASEIVDAGGLNLTTTFANNSVGVVTNKTDPRGNFTSYVVNELDQIVRETSRPAAGGVRYRKDTFYDANNNVRRVDFENWNEASQDAANPVLTTTFEYEMLNNLIRKSEEVEPGHTVVTEYTYDGNRNRILTRFGEATRGGQPANTLHVDYDARDLPSRETRARGHAAQSTTAFTYDGNRNLIRTTTGIESTNARVTEYQYDGLNRRIVTIDPMGNESHVCFDANGNKLRSVTHGASGDVTGQVPRARLSEESYRHDDMDRLVRTDTHVFDIATQSRIADGLKTTLTVWSPNSQVLSILDDNRNATVNTYDTANRLRTTTDAAASRVTYDYDANNNVTRVTEDDHPDIELFGPEFQRFITEKRYDGLDRLFEEVDSAGSTTRHGYDSRNNRVRHTDGNGNIARFQFDGLNRLTNTTLILTDTGSGDGVPVDTITASQSWDDSSRLVRQTDDNQHATIYAYDPLNRQISITYADGTVHHMTNDVFDNVVGKRDANGTIFRCEFDALNRLVRKTVTPGSGVDALSRFEAYAYDGLSRMVRAEDDDSVVQRLYNSLSQVTGESVSGYTRESDPMSRQLLFTSVTQQRFDASGDLIETTYPAGSQVDFNQWPMGGGFSPINFPSARTVTRTYDSLHRLKTVRDNGALIARYLYAAGGRVARCEFGNGTRTDYEYDGVQGVPNPPGDFGVKHPVRIAHSRQVAGASIYFDDRRFTWDRAGNKLSRQRQEAGGITQAFRYDSANRLVASGLDSPGASSTNEYRLDGLGNRNEVVENFVPSSYLLLSNTPPATEPGDFEANQYTATPFDSRTYDRNGNLLARAEGTNTARTATFDFRNQLVAFRGAGVNAFYAYDALGRRILKAVTNVVATNVTLYLNIGDQVCEERDGGGQATAYVFGRHLDDVLTLRRGTNLWWYHGDDQANVGALTDASGHVVERCEYADYGVSSFLAPDGQPRAASVAGNSLLFQGHRLDEETGFYHFRARYLDPKAGRFVQRDPKGYVDGMNLFSFAGNNPWSRVDPLGTDDEDAQTSSDNATDSGGQSYVGPSLRRDLAALGTDATAERAKESVSRDIDDTLAVSDGDLRLAHQRLAYRGAVEDLQPLALVPGGSTFLSALNPDRTSAEVLRSAAIDTATTLALSGASRLIRAGRSGGVNARLLSGERAPGRIVIGEDMERVRAAAQKLGAETFEGTGMEANRAWLRSKGGQGYQAYDVGPAFKRRLDRHLKGERPDSRFYGMERMETQNYPVIKLWERSSKWQGGSSFLGE